MPSPIPDQYNATRTVELCWLLIQYLDNAPISNWPENREILRPALSNKIETKMVSVLLQKHVKDIKEGATKKKVQNAINDMKRAAKYLESRGSDADLEEVFDEIKFL